MLAAAIAFTGQRYKIWKQITTAAITRNALWRLLLLVKDTKFESKSQPIFEVGKFGADCFYWSKIQNLKANHNSSMPLTKLRALLLLVKDTKFESKSQQPVVRRRRGVDCFYWSKIQNLKANHNHSNNYGKALAIAFTGQRYKIWKQITTASLACCVIATLLLLVKDTKFESKSQPGNRDSQRPSYCFYWSKIQNLKANHNPDWATSFHFCIAFTGQRYKIWKQITTNR